MEAPVETTVAELTPEETADESEVTADLTVDMPTVAVDRAVEARSQMLFSVETWADVEPVVVLDWADDSNVISEVTEDSWAESEVAVERAVD